MYKKIQDKCNYLNNAILLQKEEKSGVTIITTCSKTNTHKQNQETNKNNN